MKPIRIAIRACSALSICITIHAFAQSGLKLEHDSSWEIMGRQCTIRVFQLANLGSEETGPLFLSVYTKPGAGYDGTGSPGIRIVRAPIGPLAANTTTNNIVVTAKARSIPPGEKYSTLVVETQSGRTYEVADYVLYTSSYTFPRGQSGGVGSEDAAIGTGDIAFVGTNALTGVRRRADFVIEEIQNRRENTASGPLRLAIYATPTPYDGSTNRVVIATRPLGQLAQGDFYNHLKGRMQLKRPGRGAFYLTLAVEEDQGSGFQTVTYATYPDTRQF
jgi:hypothetical protein